MWRFVTSGVELTSYGGVRILLRKKIKYVGEQKPSKFGLTLSLFEVAEEVNWKHSV